MLRETPSVVVDQAVHSFLCRDRTGKWHQSCRAFGASCHPRDLQLVAHRGATDSREHAGVVVLLALDQPEVRLPATVVADRMP